MGNWFKNGLVNKLFGSHEKPPRIICCGLDAAGKTTMFYKMKIDEYCRTIPTIGFHVESYDCGSFSFTSWDVGGEDKIRPLWRHYYAVHDAYVFMIDGNDRERMSEAWDELRKMMSDKENLNKPILIFMNKADLPNSMPAIEFVEKRGVHEYFRDRNPNTFLYNWYIQDCCAVSGDGLFEGFDLLSSAIQGKPKKMGYHLEGYYNFMRLYGVLGWQPYLHMVFPPEFRRNYVWSMLLVYYRRDLPLDLVKHILSFVEVVKSDTFDRKRRISENFNRYEHLIMGRSNVKKILSSSSEVKDGEVLKEEGKY